jgi:hypothetical protein
MKITFIQINKRETESPSTWITRQINRLSQLLRKNFAAKTAGVKDTFEAINPIDCLCNAIIGEESSVFISL